MHTTQNLPLHTGAPRGATVFAVSQEAWVLEIQRHAVADLARRRPSALDEMAAAVALYHVPSDPGERTPLDLAAHAAVVARLRALAKAYEATAPLLADFLDLTSDVPAEL